MIPVSMSLADRFPGEVVSFATSTRGCLVVRLRGEFDVATVPLLAEILAAIIAVDGADVTIDVRDVGFVDSAAVRVFEHGHAFLVDHDRVLRLSAPTPVIRLVLDLCDASVLVDEAVLPGTIPSSVVVRCRRWPTNSRCAPRTPSSPR